MYVSIKYLKIKDILTNNTHKRMKERNPDLVDTHNGIPQCKLPPITHIPISYSVLFFFIF